MKTITNIVQLYELESKLQVSPVITPFKKFRLQVIWGEPVSFGGQRVSHHARGVERHLS